MRTKFKMHDPVDLDALARKERYAQVSTIHRRSTLTADRGLSKGGEARPRILDPLTFELILEIGKLDKEQRPIGNRELSLGWLIDLCFPNTPSSKERITGETTNT